MAFAQLKLISLLCPVILSGCGTYVPDLQLSETEDAEGFAENVIVNNVQCELMMGVKNTLDHFGGPGLFNDVTWLSSWGATVTLKITVDEKSGFGPGVTLIGQNFSSPLGASFTSDATRVETIAFTYSFRDLLAAEKLFEKVNHKPPDCSENEKRGLH
jgi:hypothetical protein